MEMKKSKLGGMGEESGRGAPLRPAWRGHAGRRGSAGRLHRCGMRRFTRPFVCTAAGTGNNQGQELIRGFHHGELVE